MAEVRSGTLSCNPALGSHLRGFLISASAVLLFFIFYFYFFIFGVLLLLLSHRGKEGGAAGCLPTAPRPACLSAAWSGRTASPPYFLPRIWREGRWRLSSLTGRIIKCVRLNYAQCTVNDDSQAITRSRCNPTSRPWDAHVPRCLLVCLSVGLSVCWSVCLSVCLSV